MDKKNTTASSAKTIKSTVKFSRKVKRLLRLLSLMILLASSAVAVFLILFDLNFSGKIYPRVSIAGLSVSNIPPKTAQKLVEKEISLWQKKKIQIEYSEPDNSSAQKKWQIEPEKMGFLPSSSKTTLAAYNLGRTGNPLKMIWQKIKIIAQGENLDIYHDFAEDKFNNYFENNFSFLEKPSKDATLIFDNGKVADIPAQNGYKIDRLKFKNEVETDIKTLAAKPVLFTMAASRPEVTDGETKEAKFQTNNLLESKVSLKFEDKSWTFDQELLRSAIQFEPVKDRKGNTILGLKIDNTPIIDYLEKIQIEINREPTDAVFGEKDGNIIVESGGETGAVLGINSSAKKIDEEMLDGAKINNKNIEIRPIIEEKDPAISKKMLEDLGINALIGQGKSNFAGSPKNRRYNIGVGAAKFNNITIAPGEEFSFVKTLGEITTKAGYLPELVIKGNKTIPELGGGLCQVSTTAFRAAIYSGLPILERKAHAYAVVYYAPHGMDATIYPPHPDLRFKNDTDGVIFVQTKIDKNELTFNFFGVKQNRTIKIIGPNVYDRQANGAMKAVFWREFYDGDGKFSKKEPFYSSYASPAQYPHKNPLE